MPFEKIKKGIIPTPKDMQELKDNEYIEETEFPKIQNKLPEIQVVDDYFDQGWFTGKKPKNLKDLSNQVDSQIEKERLELINQRNAELEIETEDKKRKKKQMHHLPKAGD